MGQYPLLRHVHHSLATRLSLDWLLFGEDKKKSDSGAATDSRDIRNIKDALMCETCEPCESSDPGETRILFIWPIKDGVLRETFYTTKQILQEQNNYCTQAGTCSILNLEN